MLPEFSNQSTNPLVKHFCAGNSICNIKTCLLLLLLLVYLFIDPSPELVQPPTPAMAAYAALVSLMNNIEQIMIHPRLFASFDSKLIQSILEKARFLLDSLEVYNYGGGNNEAGDLERRIASAAHAAEDVIESHIVDQIHSGTTEASPRCSLHLQRIIQRIDDVMEKAAELKEREGSREEQLAHPRPLMETAMVGLDAELIQLLHELAGQQSSRRVISVVGMGGIGKTTLAKNVYEHSFVMHHFDIRAWVTVSHHHNLEEILSELLSGLGKFSNGTVDELGVELHKTLTARRYLIILDDLWSVEVWDELKRFLPDNRNSSRVVLTTRLLNVANDSGKCCFTMNLLDEDNSWKLFCEKVFQHQGCPPELEEVGRQIVKLCRGLPLSIVVIGGSLLKSPRTVGYWEDVAKDIKSIRNSKVKQESLDVLSLSYSHLPPHLKPCFLYMGVFQENSEIRVSNIIRLWIAEGFIRPNGIQVLEEIAEGYLNDLIGRNLILVRRRRHNERIGSCCLHDILRDLCFRVAEQREFFHVSEGGIRGIERRLLVVGKLERNIKLPFARSITIRNRVQQPDRYRLLRVLNEARYGSQDLFENVNLRYLAYRLPNFSSSIQSVWELPTSVYHIWNLQTFIIRECPWLIVAPVEIWKMRQLRHVECHQIYLPDPPPSNGQDGLLILDNLQTLTTTSNLKLCKDVCHMIPNVKKLYIVYDSDSQGYDDGLIECLGNLDCLHKLESLKMSINGSRWLAPDSELSEILRFPSSLNKLSLSRCKLHWEDLKMVGSLPRLEVLKLEKNSVMRGEEWSPAEDQFPRLKFLKIDCCHLVRWNAESSHFPLLEKLVLRDLVSLREIPWGIGEIPTLEVIRVDRCSTSAAISAMKMKEDQLECRESDDLQIQVVVRELHLEIFREKVETERLSINSIQLEISSTLVELETEFD